ncbi:MAG TPA: hypothetical protein VGJ60_07610 [Chloroflexota bacterium]|jgi:hypothetical protein
MARLLTTGYETGDVNEAGITVNNSNATSTVVSNTPSPRSGAYCLKVAAATTIGNTGYKNFVLPARTELWVRFAFLTHPSTGTLSEYPFAQLTDASAAVQTYLSYNPPDGLLRVYGPALLGTSTVSFPIDTWHLIEWRTQLLTTSTGTTELWLDGARVVNFSGDNSATATLNLAGLKLGGLGNPGTGGSVYHGFDDIAINDTNGTVNNGRPGDGRIVLLVPNGAGSVTTLSRGGTDTGANWSQENELPPSMAQYVSSGVVADRDLYTMNDTPASGVGPINVIEAVAFAQNAAPGVGAFGLTMKSGSTIDEATAQNLSTSPAYIGARWEIDPNTGAAWTQAAVDALEGGVTVR